MISSADFFWRQLIIRPVSPWITPLHADTIFGHLCWKIVRERGSADLNDFLGVMGRTPLFTLSDVLPAGMLYRPLLIGRMGNNGRSTIEESILALDKSRTFAKSAYVPAQALADYVAAEDASGAFENLANQAVATHDFFSGDSITKNTINRFTGRVGDEGGLYSLATTEASSAKSGGMLALLVKIPEQQRQAYQDWDVEKHLSTAFTQGFGKKKSTGYGQFKIESWQDWQNPIKQPKHNKLVAQSGFVPSDHDPTDGAYAIFVKYGKLGEERAVGNNPHKKPLIMIRPGATFKVNAKYQGYVGGMISGLSDAYPDVTQYAYGMTLDF
jgi:CRISPR-associated protein Csm4